MLKKFMTVGVLGIVSISALVATGCASDGDRPHALTGDTTSKSYSDQVEDNWRHAKGLPPRNMVDRYAPPGSGR